MSDALDQLKGEYVGKTASDEDDVPNFEEIPVWVDPTNNRSEVGEDPDPDLNSFVVIERSGKEILQYGRVNSGYEYSERANPRIQQRDQSMGYPTREIRESPLDEDMYRLVRVELLGEITTNEDGDQQIRRPTKLPQIGQDVYHLGASELADLLEMPDEGQGFKIGNIESGGESQPFRLDPRTMSRHIAILGRTGVGKTHTGHVFIEELINHGSGDPGVPVVTFDIEDDVRKMAESTGGITLEPNSRNMSIPFQLIGWNEFNRFLGDVPTDKQRQVIGQAYSRVHREALGQIKEGGIQVSKDDFEEYIERAAEDVDYNRVRQTKRRALSPITNNEVLAGWMNDWTELLLTNPIVNIDVGGLGDGSRGTVISAVARMLRILREEDEIPPFVLAIDEAHEFVPSGQTSQSTEVVRDLVKTARHISIGVMLLTQSPSELDSRTLRTCNTYITLALAEPEIKEIRGLLSDLSDRSLSQIPNMEQGRAFVGTARDIMTHTVPVTIRDRETPEGAPTPDLIADSANWRENHEGEAEDNVGE